MIKEADKRGAKVIIEEDHYKAMVQKQIEDINFYQEQPSNEDNKTMSRIRHIYFKVFR